MYTLDPGLLDKRRIEASLVELFGADGTGDEDTPLITTDMAGTVLGVLPHTVSAVPVTVRDGGELRLEERERITS